MNDILYGKKITTESFYEGSLSSIKQEYEVSTFSTKEQILRDVIESLKVLTAGETHKLSIEILIDKQSRYRLVKKWVV